MAKPTERILDWASGGTTTDPGAGKEATGWVVDDRPPANWWNWILNSFGKWLTYFENKTDDVPCRIAYVGFLELGASPQVLWQAGDTATFTADGNNIRVTLATGVTSAANTSFQITQDTGNLGNYPVLGGFMLSATVLELSAYDLADTGIDLNVGGATPRVHVTIYEPATA